MNHGDNDGNGMVEAAKDSSTIIENCGDHHDSTGGEAAEDSSVVIGGG